MLLDSSTLATHHGGLITEWPEWLQVAQLSQRDRTAAWASYGQK